MKVFENITEEQKNALLKFPAYIALLASDNDGKLDKSELEESIHFTHIRTFSSDPLLATFYKEADKVFKENIEALNDALPTAKKEREQTIKAELEKLEPILNMLGTKYASVMHKSMESYANHVSKAHNNVLESFVIPFYIKGLTA